MSSRCGASEAPSPSWGGTEAEAPEGKARTRAASSAAAPALMPPAVIGKARIRSQPRPAHADAELAAVDRRRLAVAAVIGDSGGEDLAAQVGLVLAGRFEQVRVAGEGELDAVGDLEPGRFACDLDGVDDLAGEALATQLIVELELQSDGVSGFGLDLVAIERLQCEDEGVGLEGVVAA